jgi:RNA polymerase sigma-70 factor (ECF subfamily)
MDEESFHAFYEQTARNLRGYLRSMLIDPAMVDDLLQESYFRLFNANLPASAEYGHRRNYLYRIATNLVYDHRRARRLEELPDDLAAVQAPATAQDIGRAFRRLKPKDRDVLWMAYVECFSHKEIAEVLRLRSASIRPMRIRPMRIRPMLARARARFADILRRRNIGE